MTWRKSGWAIIAIILQTALYLCPVLAGDDKPETVPAAKESGSAGAPATPPDPAPPVPSDSKSAVPSPPKSTATEQASPPGSGEAIKAYQSGKYTQAAQMFEKLISHGATNADTHMYLGACYQQLKKYDLALKEYDWVAKNAPLISQKRKGETAAHTLRCYRTGVCPGNCLKITSAGWAHYPGMDPKLLWMKFTYPGGYNAWSTHHLGEVIAYENGKPVNKGKCPICHGTGKVTPLK